MNARATILLSLADVELVDPREELARRTRRVTEIRLFFLSVLLGFAVGIAFAVIEPGRSRDVSLHTRAWLKRSAEEVSRAASSVWERCRYSVPASLARPLGAISGGAASAR